MLFLPIEHKDRGAALRAPDLQIAGVTVLTTPRGRPPVLAELMRRIDKGYPIGRKPTWAAVKAGVKNSRIIAPSSPNKVKLRLVEEGSQNPSYRAAGEVFVSMTSCLWSLLQEDIFKAGAEAPKLPTTVRESVRFWSFQSCYDRLYWPSFEAVVRRGGLVGCCHRSHQTLSRNRVGGA